MSDAAFVEEASMYAQHLVKMRTRGWGDTPNAIQRVATEAGVPKGTVWALLYRRPKRLWDGVRLNLRSAYLAACENELKRLQHAIEKTGERVGTDHPALAPAEQLASAIQALVDRKED